MYVPVSFILISGAGDHWKHTAMGQERQDAWRERQGLIVLASAEEPVCGKDLCSFVILKNVPNTGGSPELAET